MLKWVEAALSRGMLSHWVPRSESQDLEAPVHLLWVSVCYGSWGRESEDRARGRTGSSPERVPP